ncbi:MAG: PEGA domain-containing protein, partial [Planctomycetota bacterium]|nr:PEGA domain-containing protein [Planctomycetota bacterium]
EVPEELEIICLKALEKDLDLRYKSAEDMASDLKSFLHKEPITATRPTVIQNLKKWTRRHKGITYGVVIALMSVALLTAFYLRLPGHLVLNTIPKGAVVIIDGEEFRTPFEDDNFPPGTYGIKFRHPGYKEEIPGVSELYVARNATTQVTYNLFSTRGTLVVRSEPPGATVSIFRSNEKEAFQTGTTAFVEDMPAGIYRLHVSLSGHETMVFPEVKVEEGNQMTRMPLVKLVPDEGFLTLRSDPGDVSISLLSDGFAPKTLLGPFTKKRVGSGTYRVLARKSGYLPREKEVVIKQGQELGTRVSLPSLASGRL